MIWPTKFPNKFIALGIYNKSLYSLKPLLGKKRLLYKLMGDEKQPVGPLCSQNNILSFVLGTEDQLVFFFGFLGDFLYFCFHDTSVPSLP